MAADLRKSSPETRSNKPTVLRSRINRNPIKVSTPVEGNNAMRSNGSIAKTSIQNEILLVWISTSWRKDLNLVISQQRCCKNTSLRSKTLVPLTVISTKKIAIKSRMSSTSDK